MNRGWRASAVLYVLAIIAVIIAIIWSIWNGSRDHDGMSERELLRQHHNVTFFWYAAIVFALLAIVQQNYESARA